MFKTPTLHDIFSYHLPQLEVLPYIYSKSYLHSNSKQIHLLFKVIKTILKNIFSPLHNANLSETFMDLLLYVKTSK